MTGGSGALRAGRRRWPLAWLVATTLFVGVLIASVFAWLRPTDLLTLGEPPSMRIVRAMNGRLYFIRFECTDPASPLAMQPMLINYRREFLRPRPMDWYPRLGESKEMIVRGGGREREFNLVRDEYFIGVRLKPIFFLSLALYVGFIAVFVMVRRSRVSTATRGFPMSINAPAPPAQT